MAVEPIANHADIAVRRLRAQYRGLPRIEALVRGLVSGLQDVEDAFQGLYAGRSIAGAVGLQLDLVGTIVGVAREVGEDDDDYRIRIQAGAAQNVSQGQPEAIITFFGLLVGAGLVVYNEGRASIRIASDVVLDSQTYVNFLYRELERTALGGVRIDSIQSFDPDEAFAFAGNAPGLGFGDSSDPDLGGLWAVSYPNTNLEFAFAGDDPKGGGFGDTRDPLVGGAWI